jgi:hypothetical protein
MNGNDTTNPLGATQDYFDHTDRQNRVYSGSFSGFQGIATVQQNNGDQNPCKPRPASP